MPAASLAASRRRFIGRGERCSLTRSGPPAPWYSRGPAHVVLGLDEVRQHVGVAPAGRALRLPGVVVERASAHVEHRVHRARAAERLAARDEQRASVDVRLGLGREVPVELGVELLREGRRDLDLQRAVLAAGLEQQHAHRGVLGEAVGEHAAGRAGADDHVVVARRSSRHARGRRNAVGQRGEAELAGSSDACLLAGTRACSRASWRRSARSRRDTRSRTPSTPSRRSAPAAPGRSPPRPLGSTSIAPAARERSCCSAWRR